MAEFDLNKAKEESQMFDTWRQGRQRDFNETFPLSTVAAEDLNFPEFTPENQSSAKDPFAYENQPFLKDSPFATDTNTFDPYESFRDYTSDEMTKRSKDYEQQKYNESVQRGKDIVAGFDGSPDIPEVGSEDWAHNRFKEGLGDLSMSRPQGDQGTQYNIDGQDFEIGPDQFITKDMFGNYIVADKTDNTGGWGGDDKYNELLAESDRILGDIDKERLQKVQGERDSGYDPTGFGEDLQNQLDTSKADFELQKKFDAPPTEEALELKEKKDIEDRTNLATEAGYGSLEEYDEAMSQWKPFDPKWRKAKGKWTPAQDREARKQAGYDEALDTLEDVSRGVPQSEEENIEAMYPTSEGEGYIRTPDRPSVQIESEDVYPDDPEYDMDIDIADEPERELREYEPYSQDLKDSMVESGKYDESLTYEQNVKNFEDFKSDWRPFDQDWRKAKGKHLFDPQARGEQTVEQANKDYDNLTQENKTLYDNKVAELENKLESFSDDRPKLDSEEVKNAIKDVYGHAYGSVPTEEQLQGILDGTDPLVDYDLNQDKVDALKNIMQGENYSESLKVQAQLEGIKNDPNSVEGYQAPGEKLELKDVKGTQEYKAEQKRLKKEDAAAAIDRGEGYHPDDEEWRESKSNWDKNEDGVRDPSTWETPYTQELRNELSNDFEGKDFWSDENNDGIISEDELDLDNMTEEQKAKFNDYNKRTTEEHYKQESKNRKNHGGENKDGTWQDKDYWKSYYKEADKLKRKAGKGKWQPFSHEWRKEHNKFTIRAKTLDDFDGDETKFNEYKQQRAAKIDMWAEIFKGAPGQFGGLSAMFFSMAGSNPYEYKQYIGGDKD
tara:strand:- start:3716 stop:6226 length:2511 start_codon:yes stop_codon:yes gene_type:complete